MLQAKINTQQWERALKELGKKNAIKGGIRAINRTLTSSRSAIVKQVAPDMGLQQKVVRDLVTVTAAKNTGEAPHGALYASAKKIPLIQFKARQTSKGVTAKLPTGAGKYPGAFIVTMPGSGHTGVFERTPGKYMKYQKATWKQKRQAIHELHGPSPYHVFKKHADVAQSRALEVLDKNFAHELEYLLAKAKQS